MREHSRPPSEDQESHSPGEGLHVVLVAYGIDPYRGSEPGNAWAWLTGVSQCVHRVSLVTSPECGSALRGHTAAAALHDNVDVLEVSPGREVLGEPFPSWYRSYSAWLDAAAETVGGIHADVAHHLTVGSPFWGSSLNLFGGPRILGPVGVSSRPPIRFMPRFGFRGMVEELVRAQLGAHPGMWRRGLAGVRAADYVLASDPHTASLAQSVGTPWGRELIEGVTGIRSEPREVPEPTLIWAGKLVHRKGPLLALQAWQRARADLPIGARLVMMGDGPDKRDLEHEARRAGLADSVLILGAVSRQEVQQRLENARGLLFTSLRDTSSSQMLEAMAVGTPAISLRHSGVGGLDLWYPRNLGWAHEESTWRGAVRGISAEIVQCLTSSDRLWMQKSDASRHAARPQTWSSKVERVLRLYRGILEGRQ